MKLAKIVQYGVGGIVIGSIALGALYAAGGWAYNRVAIHQNSFSVTIQARGKEVTYEGTNPYSPLIKFGGNNSNGDSTIKFKGDSSMAIIDDDLTTPGLSLEDRVKIVLPGGQEIEFDYYGIYKDGRRHSFTQGSGAEQFFQQIFEEAQQIENAVEAAVKVSSLRK